ncbi:transcriptional repressor TCF25-domain-containing protein [Thelonectria olida]|uniref:Transcriptional repressor TCF25-domain-containing protein n=1 Tax=Thelonectria olida TaxID=1576542 RepID=A0A9P8WDC7_9HYPO|nr:transcriptional repressor TCF25-domain-containing protein [Thelonectria olida]
MSSRQIRKLQKKKDLEKAEEILAENSEDSDGHEQLATAKPRVSLFAALGGDDDEDEAQDEDDEAESQPVKEEVVEDQKPSSGKSKKKKKKKKKKKGGKALVEEDEIDKAIKELNLNTKAKPDNPSSIIDVKAQAAAFRRNELLSINTHHLRALNEMRSLFGRGIIESAEAEEEQERLRRQRGPVRREVDLETFLRGPPGQKKLPEVSLRRNVFIQGREHWPQRTAGGLTMKEIKKAEDGSWTEYAYFHEGDYDSIQWFFWSCVQIGDPMRMVHLLNQAPYHVSTLLQVSSIAKQDQNMSLAAELCERALFSFGRVTTSTFRQNMEQGRARLDFRRPENRQFWLAGYHYIRSLVRKGTYRTALEWAKLLFALDPSDPYSMRYFINALAIRAHEARWLVDFVKEVEARNDHFDFVYLQQTLVLAKLQMGDQDGARADLEAGLKRVPWLYCALFQELNLDTPSSIWGINAETDERLFWVRLYLSLAKDLWNNTQAIALLQSVAKALDKVDDSNLLPEDLRADLGPTRLAYLSGETSLLAAAPKDLLEAQPNYEFDPLPPPEKENIFTGQATKGPWMGGGVQPSEEGRRLHLRLMDLLARQPGGPVAPMQAAIGGAADDLRADALRENDESDDEIEEENGRDEWDEYGQDEWDEYIEDSQAMEDMIDMEELEGLAAQTRGEGTGMWATLRELVAAMRAGHPEGYSGSEGDENTSTSAEDNEG